MSRPRFLALSLATLITIGLLIVGGLAIYRISWWEGFKMGQLTAGAAEGVLPPSSFGYPGLLLTLGIIFLLLIVVGKFFRLWAWKMAWGPWMMAGGPQSQGRARHWHRHHGSVPPWCWGWEKPVGEQDAEAESEAQPQAA